MIRLLISRLVQAVVVLFCIVTITFFILRSVPGSPFQDEKAIPDHLLVEMKAHYALDQPWHVQLGRYYYNFFVKLDGGPSMSNLGFTVSELIRQSFPVSFKIAMGGLAIALALGIPIGVIAAARRNTRVDYALMSIALAGICLPTFVIGPLLSQFMGITLDWFPAAGWWGSGGEWFLPSLTLGLFYAGYFARLTRGGMLDILSQDFIRTAHAKGVPEWRVLVVHTLRGGMLPAVTFMGPAVAGLVGGSFVVEKVFAVPGQGLLFINAVTNRDQPLIMGCVLVYGVLILIMNFLVDLFQILLDPRVRDLGNPQTS